MKKTMIFAALAAITLVSTSCEEISTTRIPERKDIVLSKSQQAVLQSGSDFNFDLLREVTNGQSSAFVSPLSIQAAFCMAANGAEGETFDEIAKAIGYEGYTIEEINSMYNTLIEGLAKVDKSTTFEIANSIWVNKDFPVYPDYIETLKNQYAAQCKNLDFQGDKAVNEVNKWCSDHTDGMVPKIMDSISPELELLLINALYFKGIWASPFEASNTKTEDFTAIDGSKVKVEMMHQTKYYRYADSDEAQFCALPFGNGAYELDIVLPHNDVDFQKYLAGLNTEKWNALVGRTGSSEVTLSVPKLSLDRKIDLVPVLKNMGIQKAFTNYAEFPGISEIALKIAEVAQRAVFKMDEKGAKAAAVTYIGFAKCTSVGPSEQIYFTADHPYVFAIRETTSGAILFMGTNTGK